MFSPNWVILYLCANKTYFLEIFRSIQQFQTGQKTVLTLGTFDGVHVGHRKIVDRLLAESKASGLKSVILTFFPHPRMVLQERSEIKLLNTLDERIALLEQSGLDALVIHPFDEAFSRLTAEAFVADVLVAQFNIGKIIIGYDHRFGRNRTANIVDLKAFGAKYGFEVEEIPAREIDDVSVSSTKIRNALLEGDVKLANQFLGYAYPLTGTVVHGKKLGRTIGYPTANMQVPETYKLVPKSGVYVSQSVIDGVHRFGMTNIGTNPTTDVTDHVKIETYFLDFDGDLYGKTITVSLLHRLRDELKFDTLDTLVAAIDDDARQTSQFIASLR